MVPSCRKINAINIPVCWCLSPCCVYVQLLVVCFASLLQSSGICSNRWAKVNSQTCRLFSLWVCYKFCVWILSNAAANSHKWAFSRSGMARNGRGPTQTPLQKYDTKIIACKIAENLPNLRLKNAIKFTSKFLARGLSAL